MRYAIFSDMHSNLEAFESVIKAMKGDKVDAYICAGDIVGYGADPSPCIRLTKELTGNVICGNHDWASVGKFDVSVTAGPSYSTKRQEAADQMLQLVTAMPEYRVIIAPKIVKGLDFDGAEELSQEMVEMTAGAGQPPEPSQEEQIDIMNKVLNAEGKELVNTQRKMDIEGAINDQDERTKALIIQALEATGLLPEGMGQPV